MPCQDKLHALDSFNTQPPEGGCLFAELPSGVQREFQHTAARRRLSYRYPTAILPIVFQHTAARRRLKLVLAVFFQQHCFNTQPPEGGWAVAVKALVILARFNTQPPEGGWALKTNKTANRLVSTHSRPKAAGIENGLIMDFVWFQHTAARRRLSLS